MGELQLGHVVPYAGMGGPWPTYFEALFFDKPYTQLQQLVPSTPVERVLFSGMFISYRYDREPEGLHPNTGGQAWVSVLDLKERTGARADSAAHLFAGATPEQLIAWVEEWGGIVYVPRRAAAPDIVITVPGVEPQTTIIPAGRVPEPLDAPWRPLALGELIDKLKGEDQTDQVRFDFGGFLPRKLASYRGYYEQLALGYDDTWQEPVTVADLLAELGGAVGREYDGYKGGTYEMRRTTPVWAANWGESPGTGIVGVRRDTWVILETVYIG